MVNPFFRFFFMLTMLPVWGILFLVMKLAKIRNGSLYYNTKTKKVERVISNNFSKSRVVTERHGKNQKAIPAEHLRLATQEEVDRYLTKPNFLRILGSWLLPKGAWRFLLAFKSLLPWVLPLGLLFFFTLAGFTKARASLSWDIYTSPHNTNPRPTPWVFLS